MVVSISACTMLTPGKRASLFRSRATNRVSISTAITLAPCLASASVSTPKPGPTSTTMSPAPTSAADRIRCNTASSVRKCCPSRFFGRNSDRPTAPCLGGFTKLSHATFPPQEEQTVKHYCREQSSAAQIRRRIAEPRQRLRLPAEQLIEALSRLPARVSDLHHPP